MIIRPLLPEDIRLCAQLMAASATWQRYGFTEAYATQYFEEGLRRGATIFAVDLNGKMAGFVWVEPFGAFARSGYIRLIGVQPELRNQRLGRALMEYAEALLFKNADDIFLLVSDFNTSAQRFYQRLGYQPVGSIPDYLLPGIDELIYRKRNPMR